MLSVATEFVQSFWSLTVEMGFYLLIGFLVAGLLHTFLSVEFVARFLGKNSLGSVFKSVLLGAPLPLCSCGVLPVAGTLTRSGASRASVAAFLVATPVTGVDSILATFALLGPFLGFARPLAGVALALMVGVLVLVIHREPTQPPAATLPSKDPVQQKQTLFGRVVESLRFGFDELLGDLSRTLGIGLLLGAGIAVLLPQDLFAMSAGNAWQGYLLAAALGTPLYVCATGSIPIAAALMLKGLSPGGAMVFLLVGPATNMVTLSVVRSLLGTRITSIYLTAIVLGGLALGFATDQVMEAMGVLASAQASVHIHDGHSLWMEFFGVVLLAFMAWHLVGTRLKKKFFPNKPSTQPIGESMKQETFKVPEASCKHCSMTITNALKDLSGVEQVDVDLDTRLVTVGFDTPISIEEISKAMKDAGYENEKA